jgi:hypothetical protein
MMNGYAMSGWGWLLMTVGMLGFWALVAVSPSPCCGAPANPTSSHSPASPISSHGPAPRTSWPSGWPAASSTPTSTASASRPSRRPPTGHDPRHLQSPSPIPRVGSAAQPGQQLRPVSQLLLHHGAEHRLVDVPVHLIPVDAPNGGCGSYSIATWTIRAVGSSARRTTIPRAMSMPADTPAEVMNLPSLRPPLRQVGGAQALQQPVTGPVGGGLATLQQPGRGQDQRPGADRPDYRHGVGSPAQVVADDLVAHGLDGGRTAAGDDHHLRVGHLVEGMIGGDGERAVGGHGLKPLGYHHRPELVVELPQRGEDLQRSHHVEQRDALVEHERDRLLLLGCH